RFHWAWHRRQLPCNCRLAISDSRAAVEEILSTSKFAINHDLLFPTPSRRVKVDEAPPRQRESHLPGRRSQFRLSRSRGAARSPPHHLESFCRPEGARESFAR